MAESLHRFRFRAMGCPCELQLYAPDPDAAHELAAACRGEVERLEQKYSRYRDDSVVSRVNRSAGDAAGAVVDRETASLLDYADTCHANSGGLFDVTSGILRRAWDFRSGRLPAPGAVEALLPRVGWQRVRWERPRLVLPLPGMEIDLGGYVKEYAADRLAELCRRLGARAGLVDLGGDLAIVGPHPDGRPWMVGIRDARDPQRALRGLPVERGGVATSGDYERCMVVDGVRYGHILDPRTGWPVAGWSSVTVVAERCLIAGTASTIALLQAEGAGAWLDALRLPHVRQHPDGRVVCRTGSEPAPAAPRRRPGPGSAVSRGAPRRPSARLRRGSP